MSSAPPATTTMTSIIDNRGGNTLHAAVESIGANGRELCIATAFFSLDALNLIGEKLQDFAKVRLLFGDDASKVQRKILLDRMRQDSERDLLKQRQETPLLDGLRYAQQLIDEGRFEARCYVREKFHAKAYISHLPSPQGPHSAYGILGSGNFTRPGLSENIELNAHLTPEQTGQLIQWYEERWQEAQEDEVTLDIRKEIERHLKLYDPYLIYQKALREWGGYTQGSIEAKETLKVREVLDPHQLLGVTRALQILDRDHGVMVCDGVGLGKSFVALGIMEHFCAMKKNVLLIAPKSIMESSWRSYLSEYLAQYQQPFGTIFEKYMTDLGFDAEEESNAESLRKKQEELRRLAERADVIVIDESHNFRSTNVQRYINLHKLAGSLDMTSDKRKKIVLLTATPINTKYSDLSAQLTLISHDMATIGGYTTAQIRAATSTLDNLARMRPKAQLTLDFQGDHNASTDTLDNVLNAVVIQRKRTTCINLAASVGKTLLFPNREVPVSVEYELSDSYRDVVETAHKRFSPVAAYLKKAKKEYEKARVDNVDFVPPTTIPRGDGLKFAGYLPEQYRLDKKVSRRGFQVEITLANLVFTNTLKQLESSPAAFQGILQSLGLGLVSRLKYVFGDEAERDIDPHLEWVRAPINTLHTDVVLGTLEDGENLDLNGEEIDAWLQQAIAGRHLHHKLAAFKAETYDIDLWRRDIVNDLKFLKEIHYETLQARTFPDRKLEKIKSELRPRLENGQRIVVFTQSQRTSFYLEKAIKEAFPDKEIARIDSNVKQETRDDILYAFCPSYNPRPKLINRERVDILICTDVLSEGVNMQEAECILSYDIHWNPVRLIQRIGRVDRRLDPAKHPIPHTFSILNVFPPKEINDIIKLVDTVEERTTKISKTLGIDQAFFKSTDEAGTLREFNSLVDGEPSAFDRVTARYVQELATPDAEVRQVVDALPSGALGIWEAAPVDGVFALFRMEGTDRLNAHDRDYFKSIIGRPVLALITDGKVSFDAPEILEILAQTVKGEPSGKPQDREVLKATLAKLRNQTNQSYRGVNLVSSIQPSLICWMELRKSA